MSAYKHQVTSPGSWVFGQNEAQIEMGGQWTVGLSFDSEVSGAGPDDTYMCLSGVCAEADVKLCAEAGTVLHETGLTPRELAGQCVKLGRERAELLAALKDIGEYTGQGPYSTRYQEIVRDIGAQARAAIAKCEAAQ